MFEFFEMMGDNKPNAVDEGLKEMCESPQGASDDSRNEKITGDKPKSFDEFVVDNKVSLRHKIDK